MNGLKNKVQLIGNLGKGPEMIELDSGKTLTKFSMATNETYKNAKGDKVTDTQWHNIVAWGKTAEIAGKYLEKGSEIILEGSLATRSYENKEGKKVYVTEIITREFIMLGSNQTTKAGTVEVVEAVVIEPVEKTAKKK